MSRSVALVLAWLVAASASLAVAWRGVAVVGDQVTDDRPAPLTAAELGAPATTAPADGSGALTTAPTDATPATSTTATDPDQPPAETRSYNLEGGNVTLWFEPSGVTAVVAQPNPGFSLDQQPEHGNGWRVEFESDAHRSRLDGWWDNGPRDEIREEPRN